MHGKKLSSWADLQRKFGLSNRDIFRYMQFRGIFQAMDLQSFGQQSNLEDVMFDSESGDHLTGKVYRLLQKSYSGENLSSQEYICGTKI